MKYLINDIICEKVEVGGFDYYYLPKELNIFFLGDETEIQNIENNDYVYHVSLGKNYKVIATNNSSLDLPQVVDEVKEYTKEDMVEFTEWLITKSFREGTSDYTTSELLDIWNEQRIIKLNVK